MNQLLSHDVRPTAEIKPSPNGGGFNPDATMIIDRTGKERSHDDFDYRFPEVWVAKVRSHIFHVRGIQETSEWQSFVRAITVLLKSPSVTQEQLDGVLSAFNAAHTAYEAHKLRGKTGFSRPNSAAFAERLCEEIAGAYRENAQELLGRKPLTERRDRANRAFLSSDRQNTEIRRVRDLTDLLLMGLDGFIETHKTRSKENAGYLVLANIDTLFKALAKVSQSKKIQGLGTDLLFNGDIEAIIAGKKAPANSANPVEDIHGDVLKRISMAFEGFFSKRS